MESHSPLVPFATTLAALEEPALSDGPTDKEEKTQITVFDALDIPSGMASRGQAPLAPFATALARLEESVPDDGPTDGDEKMQATSLHALGIPDDEESRGQVSPVPLYTSASAEGVNNDVETNTRSSIQIEAQSALVHPPDRGLHAWLFLAGSFSTETVVSSNRYSIVHPKSFADGLIRSCILLWDLRRLLQKSPSIQSAPKGHLSNWDYCIGKTSWLLPLLGRELD